MGQITINDNEIDGIVNSGNPEFDNLHNECVTDTKGREHWISRSVALVGVVMVVTEDDFFFLIGKRGPLAADNRGKWNLPCGYLDWRETGHNACVREIFEETGLKLPRSVEDIQPNLVSTKLSNNRENVSMYYEFCFETNTAGLKKLESTLSTEFCEEGEVEEVKFISHKDIDKYDFCFGHEKRMKNLLA